MALADPETGLARVAVEHPGSRTGSASPASGQQYVRVSYDITPPRMLAVSGGAEVDLERLALRFDRPAEADYAATVRLKGASATLKALPAPVSWRAARLRVDPARLRLDGSRPPARRERAGLRQRGGEGAAGRAGAGRGRSGGEARAVGIPARRSCRSALSRRRRCASPRGARVGAGRALDLDAQVELAAGLRSACRSPGGPARWTCAALRSRMRAATPSSARCRRGGDRLQASFAGTLHGRSIARCCATRAPSDSGAAQGELRLTIDRTRRGAIPGRGPAAGRGARPHRGSRAKARSSAPS